MTQYLRTFLMISMLTLGGCATNEFGDRAQGHDVYGTNVSEYERGKINFAAKRFGLALKQFKKALIQAPKNVEFLNGLAATFDKLGRFDLSKRYYQMALTVDPNSPETLSNFGYSYYMQRKHDVAKVLLREASAKSNDKWTGHANLHLLNKTVETATHKNKTDGADETHYQIRARKISSIFTPPSVERVTRPTSDVLTKLKASRQVKKLQLIRTAAGTHTIFTRHYPGITQNPLPEIKLKKLRKIASKARTAPKSNNSTASTKFAASTTASPGRILISSTPAQQNLKTLARKQEKRDSVSIIITNGTGRSKMASRMRGHLNKNGYQLMWLGNAANYRKRVTTVFYKQGLKDRAERLAAHLPVSAQFIEQNDLRTSLQLELGADLLDFDKELIHQLKKVQTNA